MKVDMSPQAIDARLRLVSQLTALCISLGKAKKIETAKGKNENNKPKEKAK